MNGSTLRSLRAKLLVGLLAASGLAASPWAQEFPTKPITMVVPFSAGSPTDVAARALGSDLGAALKTPVLVDNRPGASQTIAASFVWRAPADGYTLLLANIPAVVAPSLVAKLPYGGLDDFSALADVMSGGLLLATSTQVKAENLKQFIGMLRANPSSYSYGSSGIGSVIHLAAELFNKEIGVSTVHAPFKGTQQVVQELIAGRLDYSFVTVNAMEYVRTGRLKALGVTTAVRDSDYPEVPTMSEAGMPGFQAKAYFVLVGPKAMPQAVVDKINAAACEVLASPEFQKKLKSLGGVTVSAPSTVQDTSKLIKRELGRWSDLVKKANIQLE